MERLVVLKRDPLDAKVPPSGRKRAKERQVLLKREPLDPKRSPHIRDEESKGKASCPEKRASRCEEKFPVSEKESNSKASCPEKRASRCT